ncbi:MAG: DUF3099 domain-containing protein [Microbacterium pygmaeum]
MKSSSIPPSATSLPRAPQDDAGARSRRYLVMMAIRIACFVLMVLITPYGWYTWVFAAGAIVLPYVAVVLANVGEDVHRKDAENPERALTAGPVAVERAPDRTPPVIQIQETRSIPRTPDQTNPPVSDEDAR